MLNNLKIVALSLPIAWADVSENLQNLTFALGKLSSQTDLVVLPELFTTGFLASSDMAIDKAEQFSASPTIETLKSLSNKHNLALCGSVLVAEGDTLRNRCLFIEPGGDITYYDKHHLFCISRESQSVTAGSEHSPIVRFRGWNISMAVCYDLRFPGWLRNRALSYDLLLVVANWPQSRQYQWEHLLIARAIENQAYVCGVNRSGADDFGTYDGMSRIYSPTGQNIGKEGGPLIITAELRKVYLEECREHFPVWRDAD